MTDIQRPTDRPGGRLIIIPKGVKICMRTDWIIGVTGLILTTNQLTLSIKQSINQSINSFNQSWFNQPNMRWGLAALAAQVPGEARKLMQSLISQTNKPDNQ